MASKDAKVEFAGKSCDACGKAAAVETPLRRCHGCKAALYCSRDCQKGDWPIHKHMCRDKLPTVPIETRTPGVIKVGPVTTAAQLRAAKPGDAPPKDEDRVLLYSFDPEEIHRTSTRLMDEYKEKIKREVRAKREKPEATKARMEHSE